MKITRSFPLWTALLLLVTLNNFASSLSRHFTNSDAAYRVLDAACRVSTDHFATSWKQVDSLINLGQPRSALEVVNKIYTLAKKEKNEPQVIKAIIYRIRLNSDFAENFMTNTITGLQKEISSANPPAKQILQSILAEVYWKYYQNNQYRFRNRTQIKSVIPDSVETWDLTTLYNAIQQSYLKSLENADTLKRIPISRFDAILDAEVFDGRNKDTLSFAAAKFTPTLYDFIAGRALDYFTSAGGAPTLPAHRFEVDQPWFFAQPATFAGNVTEIPADPSSPASFAMRIFRDLSVFHLNDRDRRAFIETELKRLAFVYEKYTLPGKDSLYLVALQQFELAENASAWCTSISFTLASFLNNQGQRYQPLISEANKWDIRLAQTVCEKAITRFSSSEGAKNCKILLKSIRDPFLQVTTESAVPKEKSSLGLIGVKNLKQIFFRIVKADPDVYSEKAGTFDRQQYIAWLNSLPVTRSWSLELTDDGDHQKHQSEIAIPEVPAGFWVLLCAPSKEFSGKEPVFAYSPFWSTQISYISKRNSDGSFAWFFLDRETGLPLKNAAAEMWEKTYDYRGRGYRSSKLQDFTSDVQGYLSIHPSEGKGNASNRFLKIRYQDDILITDNFYQYPVYTGEEQTVIQTMFYLDRAIYRPGQTIWFKGILISRTGDKSKIKPGFGTKVIFRDANGQKISEQSLVSNAFGSISGSFIAPSGVLLGQMSIANETGSVYFSVEEYKRPTFEVTCDPLEGNYKLGEMLHVSGKALAYAGNAIDGARVNYRVVRTARFPFWDWGWRWPMPASPEVEITSGTTTTDAGGKFSIAFTALPDNAVEKKTWPVFDFSVHADVTDLNGETQSVQQEVSVGYKSLLIESDLPEMVNMATDTLMKIKSTNLNGRTTPVKITVTLRKLIQPDRAYKSRYWDQPDRHTLTRDEFRSRFPYDVYADETNPATWPKEELIMERIINTATDSTISLLNPVSSIQYPVSRPGKPGSPLRSDIRDPGSYLLILKATDPFGEVVEVKKHVTVFSPSSKEVPVNTLSWFVPLKSAGEPGESAQFLIGSKEDNVNLIYEIRKNDTLISREWIKINDRAMLLSIPILERYRGNFSVNFLFVKHNRVFQQSRLITVPYTDKKLGIVFETFRSKLEPGSKESWKVKIAGPGGKPAGAEFLAGMYDASLDLFRSNEWSFTLYQRFTGVYPWDVDNAFRTMSGLWVPPGDQNDNYQFHPGLKLNWFGTNYFGNMGGYSRYSRGVMDKSSRMEAMDSPVAEGGVTGVVTAEAGMKSETTAVSANAPAGEKAPVKPKPEPAMQIRRDLRETAFFFPRLETDSTGSVTLQFTAPESLTRWKLLGLAHTKELQYGVIEKELVTRKELMVFPNAPRFVRQGDTVIFSAKIANLSDHDLAGQVKLELTDGITLKAMEGILDTGYRILDKAFNVKKGQSVGVSWRLIIPVSPDLSLLQYSVTAVSGSFSDGEEKSIPVLTNRMMVTESLPLPVRGKGTSEFSFEKLLKSGDAAGGNASLKNWRLTLEFASNPAWYAIQALPSLNDRQYDNADAIFAAWWSNSLGAYIANSNPKIKAVFNAWKNLTPDALQSNLAKNQELKSALLQETPWVMQATSETSRKQKLGLFFDPDNLSVNLLENLRKLQKLQTPNGGWCWYAGMPENRYMTQHIVTGIGKLIHLGVSDILNDPVTREMIVKAIGFLDGELVKDYENLKKYQGNNLEGNHLDGNQVQYLYARSFFMYNPALHLPEPGKDFKTAFSFYQKQAEKYWLQHDQHLQGMIALALNRLGNKEVPGLILKSLSEKALHSNELGMYWRSERGFYWYQAPIETQALMIETFDEIANDKKTVDELKIWLLKQKQTQDWRSSRATLDACYALLLRGTDLLSDDPGVKISLGSVKINSDKLTDIAKEAGTGYFRMTWSGSDVRPDMGRITVSRDAEGVAWGAVYWQYFEDLDKITPAATPMHLEKKVFVDKNSGSPVYPLTSSLKTGDKLIVRIVLTVDRDLEYVHMKDMRASALEPVISGAVTGRGEEGGGLSGYRYQDGLGYYQSTNDVATNFFFDYLHKGTYVFEYPLKVNAAGDYSNGITTIQCMYAPEFTAHSEGIRIRVSSTP